MQWEVDQGAHLWHVAKTSLEHTWDRLPDDHEIVPYWQQLIATNRNQLAPPGDPDLIYPWQQFGVPTPPSEPAEVAGDDGHQNPRSSIDSDEPAPSRPSERRTRPQPAEPEAPPVDEDPQVQLEQLERTGSHDLPDSSEEPRSRVEAYPEVSQHPDMNRQGVDQPDAADSRSDPSTTPATGWEHVVSSRQASEPAEPPAAEDRRNAERPNLDVWSSLAAGIAAAGLAGAGVTGLVRRSRRLALQQRPFVTHPRTTMPDLEDATDNHLVGVLHAADTPPAGGWAITIHDHATSTLYLPVGGLVTLQRSDLDPDAVHRELDRHDQHIPDPDSDTTQPSDNHAPPAGQPSAATDIAVTGSPPAEGPSPPPSVNGHPRTGPAAAPSVQVRIMGAVDVLRDGEPLTGLAPLTLQILIYLAIHRDGVTPEPLDVIWNGQLAPPNSQRLRSVLTKLRDVAVGVPVTEPPWWRLASSSSAGAGHWCSCRLAHGRVSAVGAAGQTQPVNRTDAGGKRGSHG